MDTGKNCTIEISTHVGLFRGLISIMFLPEANDQKTVSVKN